MIHLTDGRPELYQWDTGRKLTFDGECQQMHFSNKAYGRTVDVTCQQSDGKSTATIPDYLLQTAAPLTVYAYVGSDLDGFTKLEKVFRVERRNKPADYVFTPADQTTLQDIVDSIGNLAGLDTICKDNLVCAINEAAKSGNVSPEAIARAVEAYFQQNPITYPVESVNGQTGAVNLTAADFGALTQAALQGGIDTALEQAKASGDFDGPPGKDGAPGKDGTPGPVGQDGKDGFSPAARVDQTPDGATITITDRSGTTAATVKNGKDGDSAESKVLTVTFTDSGPDITADKSYAEVAAAIDAGIDVIGVYRTGDSNYSYFRRTEYTQDLYIRFESGLAADKVVQITMSHTDRIAKYEWPIGGKITVDPELSPDSENPVQNKAVNAAVTALNESLGAYPVVEMSEASAQLQPRTAYKWGEVAALSITLAPETPGMTNEYKFWFTSGSSPTVLSVPDSVKWFTPLKVEAGKRYEVSIENGLGVIAGATA